MMKDTELAHAVRHSGAHRNPMPRLQLVAAALSGATLLVVAPCVAQPFPSKPIRIIVPYVAGGPSDLFARAVGQLLTEAWGQPIIIDNRPGASGNVGVAAAARAPADGYTLNTVSLAFAVAPAIYSTLGYDPVKEKSKAQAFAILEKNGVASVVQGSGKHDAQVACGFQGCAEGWKFFVESSGLREKSDARIGMEDLLPSGGHGDGEQPDQGQQRDQRHGGPAAVPGRGCVQACRFRRSPAQLRPR